jgi:hypothetical protein
VSRISIDRLIVGTGVVVLMKDRTDDKFEGSFGKAYWIGRELAGEVGR